MVRIRKRRWKYVGLFSATNLGQYLVYLTEKTQVLPVEDHVWSSLPLEYMNPLDTFLNVLLTIQKT